VITAAVPSRRYYPRRPFYWTCFIEPAIEALELHGVQVTERAHDLPAPVIEFDFGSSTCVALLDYSDFPEFVEPWSTYLADEKNRCDVVLKMKYCTRFQREYDACRSKVMPVGYIVGPDSKNMTADRAWLVEHAREVRLRALEDGLKYLFDLDGVFHAQSVSPERARFMDAAMEAVREEKYRHHTSIANVKGKRTEFRQHIANVAAGRFALNVCGPQNTIDRKVVEYCALGMPIISNRGLDDLVLPNGHRFEHGANVWFVDDWWRAVEATQTIDEDQYVRLCDGSRKLWEEVFHPRRLGQWLIEAAVGYAGADAPVEVEVEDVGEVTNE